MATETKFVLIALETVRIADVQPHLPQVQLYKDEQYDVPEEISEAMAAEAVRLGFAEAEEIEVKVEDPNPAPLNDVFDPTDATRDELKAFIKANPELDEEVNLNLGDEKLRQAVVDFLAEVDDEDEA